MVNDVYILHLDPLGSNIKYEKAKHSIETRAFHYRLKSRTKAWFITRLNKLISVFICGARELNGNEKYTLDMTYLHCSPSLLVGCAINIYE